MLNICGDISSNVNEIIKAILNFFYSFFTKRSYTHKKHKKHKKHKDATMQKHKKHKKHKKRKTHIREQSTFFPLDVF